MDETYNLKIRVRLKGINGEVEYEVPRIFLQYNTEEKNTDKIIKQAIELYEGLKP